jgi:hypothetical protein
MLPSGIWRHVALVRADVTEEPVASIFGVNRIWIFIACSENVPHKRRRRRMNYSSLLSPSKHTRRTAFLDPAQFCSMARLSPTHSTKQQLVKCTSTVTERDGRRGSVARSYLRLQSWVFLPWRWRWYISPKRRNLLYPHGVMSKKTTSFIVSAVKTPQKRALFDFTNL